VDRSCDLEISRLCKSTSVKLDCNIGQSESESESPIAKYNKRRIMRNINPSIQIFAIPNMNSSEDGSVTLTRNARTYNESFAMTNRDSHSELNGNNLFETL